MIKDIDEFDDLAGFLDFFGVLLPDDIDKTVSVNGRKINVIKKDGSIQLSVTSDFDDAGIKKAIADYKKKIKDVDNDVFVEAINEVKKNISIVEMDKLLSQDSFTEDEALKASGMMEYALKYIATCLKNKIEKLIGVYSKF